MQTRGRMLGTGITSRREIDLFLARIYHEAPGDVFELVLSKCREVGKWGEERGGLNALRLANKRCKGVVESCTTSLLMDLNGENGPGLPINIMQCCRRIQEMTCWKSDNLRSLEGCPNGLKRLEIGIAPYVSDLSPLASCSVMVILEILDSCIIDISVVASMPLLEVFICRKRYPDRPSIKDLSPLAACPRLKKLDLWGNEGIKDLSPLSACIALETLSISSCPLITSLAPLSTLKNLKELSCYRIYPQTSLLPIASCTGLEVLNCDEDAVDLEELRRRIPQLAVDSYY